MDKNIMIPEVIDWRITSKCNRKCSFCYGPETAEVDYCVIEKIIDSISNIGTKVLGITGGEPLLKDNIELIFSFINSRNLKICLSTNADYYEKHRCSIIKNCTVLGLPIEGSTSEIHDAIRGKNSFDAIINAFEDSFNNSDILYRVGTVLTKLNFQDLQNIEKLLSRYKNKIVYWKIYDLVLYDDRKIQKMKKASELELDKKEKESINELGNYLGKDKIIFDGILSRCRSYLHINPNADVTIPIFKNNQTSDLYIGNFATDTTQTILDNWRKEVDILEYTHPFRCVFRNHPNLRWS